MGILNTTPVDWSTAFGGLSAWNLNVELHDALTDLQDGWTAWTPYLQGFTTHPTWSGTGGVRQGAYMRIGKTVFGRAFLKLPSSYSNGTGNYYLLIPSTMGAPKASPGGVPWVCGSGYYWDSSTPQMFGVTTRTWSSIAMTMYVTATTAAQYNVGPSFPVVPAAGDEIGVTFCYEAA